MNEGAGADDDASCKNWHGSRLVCLCVCSLFVDYFHSAVRCFARWCDRSVFVYFLCDKCVKMRG